MGEDITIECKNGRSLKIRIGGFPHLYFRDGVKAFRSWKDKRFAWRSEWSIFEPYYVYFIEFNGGDGVKTVAEYDDEKRWTDVLELLDKVCV